MKLLKIGSLVITLAIGLFGANFISNNEEVILNEPTPIIAKEDITTEEFVDAVIEDEIKEDEQPKSKTDNKATTTTKAPTRKEETPPTETKSVTNEPKYRNDIASQYEAQINAYRTSNSLSSLPITSEAKNEANMRAMQLVTNYSHNSSFSFGENIGNGTAGVDFVTAWKNSPGHNATLLREQAIAFAVSIVEHNGKWYAVASFKVDYSIYE